MCPTDLIFDDHLPRVPAWVGWSYPALILGEGEWLASLKASDDMCGYSWQDPAFWIGQSKFIFWKNLSGRTGPFRNK